MASSTTPHSSTALPWFLAHCTLNTFFALWTFGGSVFLLFLSELGLPKEQIGMVLSLFPFCGLVALVFAPLAARWGRKRIFLIGYGCRKLVMAGMLLLPWLLDTAGRPVTIACLFGLTGLFALLRALAETAYYPWYQEFVPNRQRGQFGALSNLIGVAAACVALFVASSVVQHGVGLGRFQLLMAMGCLFGLLGVAAMAPVPGGAPVPDNCSSGNHLANLRLAIRDTNFIYFLGGTGCVAIATVLLFSFLPLYVHNTLGVPAGQVVMLDLAAMAGGAVASLLGGWLADRVGSRPILMPAVIANALAPVGWLLLPRDASHLMVWCALLYFVHGVASTGIIIGSGRLLFNGVIPPALNTSYTSLYYAWMGLTGGSAPLLAGAILAATSPWRYSLAGFPVDGFAVLFALSLACFVAGWLAYWRVRPDDRFTTRELLYGVAERLLRRINLTPWR